MARKAQIRIHAFGLNRAEVMFRAGQYVSRRSCPTAPVVKPRAPLRPSASGSRDSRSAIRSGREFRGPAAIQEWSDREIFDAQVTLEFIDVGPTALA